MQLDILRFVQSFSSPFLDTIAQCCTMLGEPVALAGIFCLVYWCVDKETGRGLLLALCTSLCLNGIVKDLIRAPRPIGQEGIVSLRTHTATGYSFPSGHTQSSSVFWSSLAIWIRKRPLQIVAVGMIILVAWSRLYLGVHYPIDVLFGAIFGLLVAVAMYLLLMHKRFQTALIICGLFALLALIFGESHDTIKAVFITIGMFAGIWLEHAFVSFETVNACLSKLAKRYLLGIFLLGSLHLVMKLLFPPLAVLDGLRYGIVVFFGIGIYPLVFQKLNL